MTKSSSKIDERAARLYLDIVENPYGSISSAELEDCHKGDGDALIDCGLLAHDNYAPLTYTLDDDTPVKLEWHPEQNAYGYFDPVSGLVTVGKKYLRNYRFDGLAFMVRLVSQIDMLSRKNPIERIDKVLWELGDIRVPEVDNIINIWFARRLQDASTLQKVNDFLKNLKSGRVILLVTTSPVSGITRSELNQYHLIELIELLDHESNLIIDPDFLENKIRGFTSVLSDSKNENVSKYNYRKIFGITVSVIGLLFSIFSWYYTPNQARDMIIGALQTWKWGAIGNDIVPPITSCPSRLPCASFRGP